jgi:IS605 OrfB family transposase
MGTQILAYNTKLVFESNEDRLKLLQTLELERDVFNYCSEIHYGSTKNSIVELHAKCYKSARTKFSAKAQIVIKAETSCLAAYRSVKSNKHKIDKPIRKKKLSMSFDGRLHRFDGKAFYFTTNDGKRVKATPVLYDKLPNLSTTKFCDPKLFVRDGEIYISLMFKTEEPELKKSQLALGVDLGIRRFAATSEGKLFIDKKYNKERRRIRYLKRCLRAKLDTSKSKTAKKHLSKLSRKERNSSKNFVHNLTKRILDTKATTIAIEDINVNKLKGKKSRYQNKNRISQVAFAAVRTVLTYKAALLGKEVVCVNPAYTSQDDCVTGRRDGTRQGCRYYAKSGVVYDADVNAAVNIARKTKLPVSQKNLLDGQGVVIRPYAVKTASPGIYSVGL